MVVHVLLKGVYSNYLWLLTEIEKDGFFTTCFSCAKINIRDFSAIIIQYILSLFLNAGIVTEKQL